MGKDLEIKRKHHYIWSYYLKSWAVDKDVYYLTKKGKIAFDSVSGLACEADFYKTRYLTKQDVEYILGWSKLSPSSYLRKLHWSYLSQFVELSVISESLVSNDINDLHLKKVIEHNSLENLHSYFESGVSDIIRELANGNVSVLKSDDSMLKFCSYLGHQMTRTKSMKTSSINAVSSNTPPELKIYSELFERNWWFISYMLGFNLGFSLFESRHIDKHIFISNNSDTPFITSDNPFINVHDCVDTTKPLTPPEKADFLFPLSPSYAYMINDSNKYNNLESEIAPETVKYFNRRIANKRQFFLFSSTEKSIKEAIKSVHNKQINKDA